MTKSISTLNAPQAIGPYVQAKQIGNVIYTSGQIGFSPDGKLVSNEIKAQTHQVMQNLVATLEAAGSSLNQAIKATCFLSDMNNFTAFNEVYASYFKDNLPARSCVEVSRLPRDVLVEVEIIATTITE